MLARRCVAGAAADTQCCGPPKLQNRMKSFPLTESAPPILLSKIFSALCIFLVLNIKNTPIVLYSRALKWFRPELLKLNRYTLGHRYLLVSNGDSVVFSKLYIKLYDNATRTSSLQSNKRSINSNKSSLKGGRKTQWLQLKEFRNPTQEKKVSSVPDLGQLQDLKRCPETNQLKSLKYT
ncbi:unnamed protein product, partial [Meganyctiphanes norvegica]